MFSNRNCKRMVMRATVASNILRSFPSLHQKNLKLPRKPRNIFRNHFPKLQNSKNTKIPRKSSNLAIFVRTRTFIPNSIRRIPLCKKHLKNSNHLDTYKSIFDFQLFLCIQYMSISASYETNPEKH